MPKPKLAPLLVLENYPVPCPFVGMVFGMVKIKPHMMEVRLCRSGESIFAVCNQHRIKMFCTEPRIVRRFVDGEED
jgi:hypothetical protein